MSCGGLKDLVRKTIVEDVLQPLHNKGEWKVLVVDELCSKIINSCLKMKDIMDNGITIIEMLSKSRQPLKYLEAVYLMQPTKKNIDKATEDVKGSSVKYTHSPVKEINLAFLPIEERVFCLDNPKAYKEYYGQSPMDHNKLDQIAEQLVTVCATLEDTPCPKVRICNSNRPAVKDLAERVQSKLNRYKEAGILTDNSKSLIVILDRGFDPITPFLHELTFQAMAYDLLPASIDAAKNTYKFSPGNGDEEKKIILDENNELWRELRHLHISHVLNMIPEKLKALSERYADLHGGAGMHMTDLKDMINKMPKYKKEKANHESFVKLAEQCLKQYNSGSVERVVMLEQDLAMGVDSQDRPIDDPMKSCVHVFVPQSGSPLFSPYQKLRVLILYVLNRAENKKPLSKDTLSLLIQKADIVNEEKAIYNLVRLGINIFGSSDVANREVPPRIRQAARGSFETSRWTPVVQDIMESVVHDNNLDTKYYPFVAPETQGNKDVDTVVSSARKYGQGRTGMMASRAAGPKLIIFIMGSISYSEMRCAHQVSETRPRTRMEVIIGSDNIMTPDKYLDDLKDLMDV